MSTSKDQASRTWMDRIESAVRGLTRCLEGYLLTLRAVSKSS